MKQCGAAEVWLHAFLTSALEGVHPAAGLDISSLMYAQKQPDLMNDHQLVKVKLPLCLTAMPMKVYGQRRTDPRILNIGA
jgi:hypothetical protein